MHKQEKIFRPQSTNDDTVIAEQSDYVWDPERSHPLFLNIPTDISIQAFSTISIHKDYLKVFPFTIDATPLNYISFLIDGQNNSLNSTVIQQENLNGTGNLTQQDIQTPSHFINEEIVETIVTTTQQNISPIHPNLTTPRPKNPTLPQVTLQSAVKPSVVPKYSHMDYQTYRPMTKPLKTRKTFTRSSFAEHNYNYISLSQTTHPPRRNTHNHLFSQKSNFPNTSTNSVNFHDHPHPSQDHSENFPFFQQNRNKKQTPYYTNHLSSDDDDYNQPDTFAPYTQEYCAQKPQQTQASQNLKIYPQIQLIYKATNHYRCKTQLIHNLINQHNHKIQSVCIPINQHKRKTKYHYHNIYNIMKKQKINLQIFHKYQMPQNRYKRQ